MSHQLGLFNFQQLTIVWKIVLHFDHFEVEVEVEIIS